MLPAPEGPSGLHDEAPRVTVAPDMPRGGMVEVRAEDPHRPVRVTLAEGPPRLPRFLHVGVEVAAPARLGHLHRAVHEVARDDGLAVTRTEAHAHVARGVSRRRLEPELVGDAVVHLDQRGEPGIQYRPHAVGQNAPSVLVLLAGPVLEL